MLSHLAQLAPLKVGLLAGSVSSAGMALFGAGIAPEQVSTIVLLAAGVGAVVGSVAWIDKRIEDKIKTHEAMDTLRHNELLKEIKAIVTGDVT